ncbi:ATP-binding protein [Pediococcus pentosaceus]|uniref:ATP-binding protein n=1 Tax=Pediococcus pentosaceus TaxID=1255 RepID=UPI002073F78C|nr:ATP-binding protein [Pediococcus pentosaceus]MCM6817476.1 ATP-binding protein [Pediococcus pentosaceus]
MKLVRVKVHNFRGYNDAEVNIDDQMTTIIGKNDVGKSTIVDALEIFFNNSVVKIDKNDLNIHAENDQSVSISCEFSCLPQNIIIDSTQRTNLNDEYLVNSNGNLEIKKVYDFSKKTITPEIFAITKYPDNPELADLLYLTHTKLVSALKKLPNPIQNSVESLVANAPIRMAIRSAYKIQSFSTKEIDLKKVDGKSLWNKIEASLPIYALFQSDRPSNDSDSEVQDPMNVAIRESLSKATKDLENIQNKVKEEVTEVAKVTISKLKEMDPEVAKGLEPVYQGDPKWDKLFQFKIEDEQGIPLNKRGSGVRRLVLLNFFRAKVDMNNEALMTNGLIYAVEEPETAQHPDNQRKIMKSLLELGKRINCQILITTHLAETAKMAPDSGVRLIKREHGVTEVLGDEDALSMAAKEVGLFANVSATKIVFYVEGPSDVTFFRTLSKVLNQYDAQKYLDFTNTQELLIVPMGGGNLSQWVTLKYLKSLNLPSFYLFDRDMNQDHKVEVDELKDDPQCLFASLTDQREIENYVSPATIERYFSKIVGNGFNMPSLDSNSDVSKTLKKAGIRKRETHLKETLASEVTSEMTAEEFFANDRSDFMSKLLEKLSHEVSMRRKS